VHDRSTPGRACGRPPGVATEIVGTSVAFDFVFGIRAAIKVAQLTSSKPIPGRAFGCAAAVGLDAPACSLCDAALAFAIDAPVASGDPQGEGGSVTDFDRGPAAQLAGHLGVLGLYSIDAHVVRACRW
jgi:hypothetical protein